MSAALTLFLKTYGKSIATILIILGLVGAITFERAEMATVSAKLDGALAAKKTEAARADRAEADKVVLIKNQQAWSDVADQLRQLRGEDAAARSAENARLANISTAVAAAKQGIRNAPGADDSFTFSDAAYGLVRAAPAAGGAIRAAYPGTPAPHSGVGKH